MKNFLDFFNTLFSRFFSFGPSTIFFHFGPSNFLTQHLKRHISIVCHATRRHAIPCLPHIHFCNIWLKVRKTQERGGGGWIVFSKNFSSLRNKTVIKIRVWCEFRVLMQRIESKSAEKKEEHKQFIQVPSTNQK